MFRPPSNYYTDGYKPGHIFMLAPGTEYLYGTWIPRSTKHAPKGINKIVSFGHQLTVRWLHDEWEENFFRKPKEEALQFVKDMSLYLGQPYEGQHFSDLWELNYLPIRIKALPEGIETPTNVPHMTFVNTVKGYAWLTLYLETIISSLAWKSSTSATIALHYKRNLIEWVLKTDPNNLWLVDYLAHDFSARGLSPWDMLSSGLGHATSFRGSDTLITIPGARYFYDEPQDEVIINSVNASEHSVSTTKIFTVGEQQMLSDWLKVFPKGILSVVSDTFDLWKLITEYLPAIKTEIMSRDGKLVIRPDSGNPVDIICGEAVAGNLNYDQSGRAYPDNSKELANWDKIYIHKGKHYKIIGDHYHNEWTNVTPEAKHKGVIELLWDIFGGTINEQGYKVLDPHIGAIYGDSITLDRQIEIYERLEAKGFASTNIVLGVGSFTYQYNTRDTFGFAAKGSWFICDGKEYNIYKDPITDDGSKKSLKGRVCVNTDMTVATQCNAIEEDGGLLQVIYEDGEFYNTTTFKEIRNKINTLAYGHTN
jgi:nicotinamide phosphoribosyltransferase